jgi:hypothetical protein
MLLLLLLLALRGGECSGQGNEKRRQDARPGRHVATNQTRLICAHEKTGAKQNGQTKPICLDRLGTNIRTV